MGTHEVALYVKGNNVILFLKIRQLNNFQRNENPYRR